MNGEADDAALAAAPRLCVFSQHHPQGRLIEPARFHLRAIREAGFRIVLVAAGGLRPADEAHARTLCDRVLARENGGYDFGNWRHALLPLPRLAAERLLLVNDSVYGPFRDLGRWLDALTAAPADMWGAVESAAFGRHLQSWLLVLGPAAHRSTAFRDLMAAPVEPSLSKWALVHRYEIGLSQALLAQGLRLRAAYVAEAHGALARAHPYNPCGLLWRELLEGPVPYVKTSMLRANPTLAPGIGGWRRIADRLDPRLAALVAADLAAQGAAPPTGLLRRWRLSLARTEPSEWPEVQGALRRDARGEGVARLHAAAYALAHALGGQLRRGSASAPA